MTDSQGLSRRERQIMDVLYAAGGATVSEVAAGLGDAPSGSAVRRLLQILEEKGHARRRKSSRGFVYSPVRSKRSAGARALKKLLETFFDGALDRAFAVHLGSKGAALSGEQLDRLEALIQEARRKGG